MIGYIGAPDNFLKEGFIPILFMDKNIKFIGVQHGGCTREYAQNRFDEYNNFRKFNLEVLGW